MKSLAHLKPYIGGTLVGIAFILGIQLFGRVMLALFGA